MQEGTIARLTDRGFGFIKREGEEKDLFFHSNELKNVDYKDLREGDKVTFEVGTDGKPHLKFENLSGQEPGYLSQPELKVGPSVEETETPASGETVIEPGIKTG